MDVDIPSPGGKEKWMNSNSLAILDNYHLPRKNASFRFVILHGHLWGGKVQMLGIAERQVTGGGGRILQGQKDGDALDMEGFWLCDKSRFRAA